MGAIACRLEINHETGGARMYIMTLGVLAPYRGSGIGSLLLQRSLDACKEDPAIEEAYLHVQTSNEDAVRFYERFGFEVCVLVCCAKAGVGRPRLIPARPGDRPSGALLPPDRPAGRFPPQEAARGRGRSIASQVNLL